MAQVAAGGGIGVAIGADPDSNKFSTSTPAGWALYIWLGAIAYIAFVTFFGRRR